MKTEENQLALLSELMIQLDRRVEVLTRQRDILRMCKQDTSRVEDLLLTVCDFSVKTKAITERLQATLAACPVQDVDYVPD